MLQNTRVNEYTSIYAELRQAGEWSKVLIPGPGTFQRGASAAIAQSVPPAKRFYQLSPIIYMKAQKNPAEVEGMRRAHLRDAVAMCTLLSYLEGMVRGSRDCVKAIRYDNFLYPSSLVLNFRFCIATPIYLAKRAKWQRAGHIHRRTDSRWGQGFSSRDYELVDAVCYADR